MNRTLSLALAVLTTALALGCEENPAEVASDSTPLFKKPPSPPGGGGGDTGPADPAIAYRANGALRVMNADGSNSTVVVADGEFYGFPSWAPSGAGTASDPYRIAYQTEVGGGLATVEVFVESGGVEAFPPVPISTGGSEGQPAWSPDGAWIAYTTSQHLLGVIEVGTGQPAVLYAGPSSGAVFSPTWSPGADAIAFSEWDGGSGFALKIFHLSDGIVTTVVPSGMYQDPLNLDWARSASTPQLAFSAVRTQGRKHVSTVYTLRLSVVPAGHYQALGIPEQLADGNRPSWSPDDTRISVDGIKVIDVGTAQTTSLRQGDWSDWRR